MSSAIADFLRDRLTEMNFDSPIEEDTALGAEGLDLDSLTRAFLWVSLSDDLGVPMRQDDLDRAADWTFGQLVALAERRQREGGSEPGVLVAQLVEWLDEAGVPGADEATPISSLNLTWLLHRYEEVTGAAADLPPDQLAGAATVGGLAALLAPAAPGPDGGR